LASELDFKLVLETDAVVVAIEADELLTFEVVDVKLATTCAVVMLDTILAESSLEALACIC
jgi:hypothetical protein